MVPGTAHASSPPRSAAEPVPHLLTLGPHGKLIPVYPGMKIGRLTVPNGPIHLTTQICNPDSDPTVCAGVNTDNVIIIAAAVSSSLAAWVAVIFSILTRQKSPPDDDQTSDEDIGDNGGGKTDVGKCLTQKNGNVTWGTCKGKRGSAVWNSATWILTAVQGDFGFINYYYYYLKGHKYYLRATGYKAGDRITLHTLFKGGQQEESWFFPIE
jgi:hypothetical protein